MIASKDESIQFSIMMDEFIIKNEFDYIEGFIEYCKKYDIDIEVAAKMVSPNLKAKIEVDAINQNLLKKKGAKLPL